MVKKILLILLSAMSLFFLIAGIVHFKHSLRFDTAPQIPRNVKVISISKDDYEVLDDGTVLIYCTYTLRYEDERLLGMDMPDEDIGSISGEEFELRTPDPINVSIGGIFTREKDAHFLEENLLIADGTYTLEHGVTTSIQVVFVGRHGDHELMPDRLPPQPYIYICDPAEV